LNLDPLIRIKPITRVDIQAACTCARRDDERVNTASELNQGLTITSEAFCIRNIEEERRKVAPCRRIRLRKEAWKVTVKEQEVDIGSVFQWNINDARGIGRPKETRPSSRLPWKAVPETPVDASSSVCACTYANKPCDRGGASKGPDSKRDKALTDL
jgi:hypothetical protein